MTKVLISLRGACAGWYAPLLFANHQGRFSRVKAQLTYVSIGTNSVDQNQNAPTFYINCLIWVHTACKKATVYFSNQRQIYIEEHGSVVECVTQDRLHVLTRLIVCEYVYLPVDLAV